MGYQENLIFFNRKKTLIRQIKRIKKRSKDNLFVEAYAVLEVDKPFRRHNRRFRKGQVFLHVGGERFAQRSLNNTSRLLGFKSARKMIQIERVSDSLDEFQEHFRVIKSI